MQNDTSVSFERQQEIAVLLSTLEGAQLDGAIRVIMKDSSVAITALGGGEAELDFSALSPMTIVKLDRFLRRIRSGRPNVDNAEH